MSERRFSQKKASEGAKLVVVCNDASSDKHNCSCTCTNGIQFEQPLDPFSSTANGGSGLGLVDDSVCQADKDLLKAQIQVLEDDKQALEDDKQALLKRQQELLDQLKTCPYTYEGCHPDSYDYVLNAIKTSRGQQPHDRELQG
ncbi:hypothetical protein IG631_05301 [Alternaria alternata]|nr:hypothetical protein IG631_05301 [Alternaria alternata]